MAKTKTDSNCNVALGALSQVGLRLRKIMAKKICPHCHNLIGKNKYVYAQKNVWHETCYNSMTKDSI